MGRKPTVNLHLPPGMRPKKGARGKVWFYLDRGVQADGKRKWQPLGADFPEALRKYAQLVETAVAPAVTVPDLLRTWNTKTSPGRPKGTLDDIRWSLPHLLAFFGDPPAPLPQVEPVHITQYLNWRISAARQSKIEANEKRVRDGRPPLEVKHNEGAVRANREISWLSAAWNWGRTNGVTRIANPCEGVKRNKEDGRDIYIEDDELAAILNHADQPLREAIELAYLIGQRPVDLREILETDIKSGQLLVQQNKTTAKLRIEITGALAALITNIKTRKASIPGVRSLSLICNEQGQPLKKSAMRYRFDKARDAAAEAAPNKAAADRIRSLQFRDLRAKAASDIETLDRAQRLLGHTKRDQTEHYVRKKRGDKVSPVR